MVQPRDEQFRVPHATEHNRRTQLQRPQSVPDLSLDPHRLHIGDFESERSERVQV